MTTRNVTTAKAPTKATITKAGKLIAAYIDADHKFHSSAKDLAAFVLTLANGAPVWKMSVPQLKKQAPTVHAVYKQFEEKLTSTINPATGRYMTNASGRWGEVKTQMFKIAEPEEYERVIAEEKAEKDKKKTRAPQAGGSAPKETAPNTVMSNREKLQHMVRGIIAIIQEEESDDAVIECLDDAIAMRDRLAK